MRRKIAIRKSRPGNIIIVPLIVEGTGEVIVKLIFDKKYDWPLIKMLRRIFKRKYPDQALLTMWTVRYLNEVVANEKGL